MRRSFLPLPTLALGAFLLCLVSTLSAAQASAAPKRQSCATVGTTIDASSYARVYRSRGFAYACLRDGRRRQIGAARDDTYTGLYIYRLAGRFLATDELVCLRGVDCTASLEVRDLVSGRVLRSAQVDDDANEILDLVVTSKGEVAWIRSNNVVRQVLKLDASGPPAVLDEGNDIAFSSLSLAGNRLYWMHGDGPRTGQLGAVPAG